MTHISANRAHRQRRLIVVFLQVCDSYAKAGDVTGAERWLPSFLWGSRGPGHTSTDTAVSGELTNSTIGRRRRLCRNGRRTSCLGFVPQFLIHIRACVLQGSESILLHLMPGPRQFSIHLRLQLFSFIGVFTSIYVFTVGPLY